MEKPEPPVLRLVVWLGNSNLHAFQKKSKRGIKTPQSDKDLIRQRYNAAVSAAREEEKNERRN